MFAVSEPSLWGQDFGSQLDTAPQLGIALQAGHVTHNSSYPAWQQSKSKVDL